MNRVAIWIPLAAGTSALAATIVIHTLAVIAAVTFARHKASLGRAGANFCTDLAIVGAAITVTLGAHLLEVGVWAALFVLTGEFSVFAVAYYHSAVNYTTLGYGDVVMTEAWRFLEPLEAANGMVLFGVSTALIFAVIQRVIQERYTDLKA